MMEKLRAIISRKPLLFVIIFLVYLILVALLKWRVAQGLPTLWFGIGGILGIYFLDIAEIVFNVAPSPFRSIVFQTLFILVGIFVVTSSGSFLAAGLVLSIYLTLLLWQLGEWRLRGNLNSWYTLVAQPVPASIQRWGLFVAIALFLLSSWLFIRS